MLGKCTEGINPRLKGPFELLPDNLSQCIIWWEAMILLDRKNQNTLYNAATMKPSVRSLIDLYRLAISYPVKFLLSSRQKKQSKDSTGLEFC